MRKGFPSLVLLFFAGTGVAMAQSSSPPTARLPGTPSVLAQPLSYSADNVDPGTPGCCAEACATCCNVCGPRGRFWVDAELLLWWTKRDRVPPLVTTGPPAAAGVLGAAGTTVLFDGSGLGDGLRVGGRFMAGYWLNECQTIGIEAGYFFLGSHSDTFSATSPGAPVIARPFFNTATGLEDSELVAFPGLLAGTLNARYTTRMQGAEVNGLFNILCCCNSRLDVIGGFRWLNLEESLDITENIDAGALVPAFGGRHIFVEDNFSTHNNFYGGQLGLQGEHRWGRVFVNGRTIIALGDTHEVIDINGTTVITPPRTNPPFPGSGGGLLALPSNIGHYTRDRFTVVPEVGFNVGYQITEHVRAYVGYTFLYWSNVVRPSDGVDRNINPTFVQTSLVPPTGLPKPVFTFHDSSIWAQGVNLGLEFRF
jgi:hypothetical protein